VSGNVPPKRRFVINLHGVTSQKTAFFIVLHCYETYFRQTLQRDASSAWSQNLYVTTYAEEYWLCVMLATCRCFHCHCNDQSVSDPSVSVPMVTVLAGYAKWFVCLQCLLLGHNWSQTNNYKENGRIIMGGNDHDRAL
jgi:hypothetical protein